MESTTDWKSRAQGWLDGDFRLLTHDEGWAPCRAPEGIELWRRKTTDDPNELYRWRLARVDAPADVVFDRFVRDILEHHQAWTKEFAGGHVVETLGPDARVVYQHFEPGIPGVSKRDVCSLEVTRKLSDDTWLVSFRSVDGVPPVPGHIRIDWWGAALIRGVDDAHAELLYLDRENQGGWVPAWAMNLAMPKYLVDQAVAVRRFFAQAR